MKRLVLLLVVVAVLGVALGSLARQGVFPRGRRTAAEAAPALPETTIAVAWEGGRLTPDRLRVPRNMRVTLTVTTTDSTFAGNLAIPDYGDDAPRVAIVPGSARSMTWVTDRPGDGFEITVAGHAVGRLDVLGEHLEEDRR
jgi:hypothetical protein